MTDEPLPPGWSRAALSEVAEVRLGRQRSPKNHTGPNMRPYLRAANVGWKGLLLEDVKEMNFTQDEAAVYELRDGDVVMSEASGSIGEVGKPAIWRGEMPGCCFQNTLIRVRPAEGIDPDYICFRLSGEALAGRWAQGVARGVGIHHLGARRVAEWAVDVPPLAEQKRIVVELERRFAHLDAVERGLRITMSKLVAASDATIRAAALPVRYQGDDLPELSDGWEWTTLGEAAEVVGGVTKDSKRQDDPEYVEVPYLRVANVQRGFLALDEVATIRVPPRKAASLRLRNGDLLFNEGGDRDKLGRGWVWRGEIDDCIHQNHVFRARLTDSRLVPELVSWWGNTFGRSWFESHGKQTTNLASINLKTLKSFPVPVPPSGEAPVRVTEAQRRLSNIEECAHDVKRSVERIAVLRRALLSAAFSGRLVPQDPDDEPASELLARIAKTRAEAEAAEKEAKAVARRARKAAKETMA